MLKSYSLKHVKKRRNQHHDYSVIVFYLWQKSGDFGVSEEVMASKLQITTSNEKSLNSNFNTNLTNLTESARCRT